MYTYFTILEYVHRFKELWDLIPTLSGMIIMHSLYLTKVALEWNLLDIFFYFLYSNYNFLLSEELMELSDTQEDLLQFLKF